jgi:hypothetical protein
MDRPLRLANGVAIAALMVLGVLTRNVVAWLFVLHFAAAVLALRAGRAGAGRTLRGWAIGTNAWCLILDALLLAAVAYGLARGLAVVSWKIAAVGGVLVALLVLCALDMRAVLAMAGADDAAPPAGDGEDATERAPR